jgi:heterodisulfide reductase subunit C
MPPRSLRHAVKLISGQDVYHCRECQLCDLDSTLEMDVPLTTIVQMIMFDDEEVLTCRTVWSDQAILQAAHACKRGLKLGSILLALREEARNRGLP